MREICNYLDSITLSIDAVDNDINDTLGRGTYHYENIKKILDHESGKNIKVNINTVVSKENYSKIYELGEFLNNYSIDNWKFFKFMPLRETAQMNKDFFEITDADFENFENNNIFKKFDNIGHFEYRKEEDMENKYILIVANGDIYKTAP